jgi:hypothetical protein
MIDTHGLRYARYQLADEIKHLVRTTEKLSESVYDHYLSAADRDATMREVERDVKDVVEAQETLESELKSYLALVHENETRYWNARREEASSEVVQKGPSAAATCPARKPKRARKRGR